MRQRFGSSRHAMKWLNQLEVRQRKPGESITALGDELRQLAKTAYRKLDSIAQDILTLKQLYKLIPVEMKCRCVEHDCQSVQQAVEVIERYEAILGEAGQDRKKIPELLPMRQLARRFPFGKRIAEQEEIAKMLDRSVIEPSNSPWSSPVVLVTKKDGSNRFWVDYRVVNSLTLFPGWMNV